MPLARKKCPFRVILVSKLLSFIILQHHGARHAEFRDAVRVMDLGPLFGHVRAGPAMHLRYAYGSLVPHQIECRNKPRIQRRWEPQIHQWSTEIYICDIVDNFLSQGIRSRAMSRLEYLRVIVDRGKLGGIHCPLDLWIHAYVPICRVRA